MADSLGVLERQMTQIGTWEACGDRRCIFLRCYAEMTISTLRAIDERRFHDCDWLYGLLARFNDYYFDALQAYESKVDTLPEPWKWAHDLAGWQTTTLVEDLVLGINAHINYDLALSTFDLLSSDWPSFTLDAREERRQDFVTINDIIAETAAMVQADVVDRYSPFLRVVDEALPVLAHEVEWQADRLIFAWRAEVWRHVLALLDAASPEEREALRSALALGAVHRVRLLISELSLRHVLMELPLDELWSRHPEIDIAERHREAVLQRVQ